MNKEQGKPAYLSDQLLARVSSILKEAELNEFRIRVEPTKSGHTYNVGRYGELQNEDMSASEKQHIWAQIKCLRTDAERHRAIAEKLDVEAERMEIELPVHGDDIV